MTDASASEHPEAEGRKPHIWSKRDFLRLYVGPNWEAYLPVSMDMKKGKLAVSWSWALFFFPVIWLVYRKRYRWALGAAVLFFVLHFLHGFMWFATALPVGVLIAAYGKGYYIRSAMTDVDMILATTADQHRRMERVEARGGVSDKTVVIIVSAIFLLWLGAAILRRW
jgi:hypothetical protein